MCCCTHLPTLMRSIPVCVRSTERGLENLATDLRLDERAFLPPPPSSTMSGHSILTYSVSSLFATQVS